MTRLLLIGAVMLSSFNMAADEFKIKIDVELVDHESCAGVKVVAQEKGNEVMAVSLEEDGKSKFQLESGKLYEIWVTQSGYLPHVIHNVHAEGKSKFNITLYKATKKVNYSEENFAGVNRTFLDVKKMTIPAEYLASGVLVKTQEEMTKPEIVSLKAVGKVAKSQTKAQSKIDKLIKKRAKLDEKISDVNAGVASGESTKAEGDAQILKLQKAVVKMNTKLEGLAY